MRKTKIICTIGPKSNSIKALTELSKNGMNVARINMSHGDLEEHIKVIENIKFVREKLNIPLGIMIDLKGPEIRIGKFKNGAATLIKNQKFILTTKELLGDNNIVSISTKKLIQSVKPNQKILLCDGQIVLVVKEIKDCDIICKVKEGGTLSNNKSINVPGVNIPMKFLSDVDKLDILFGIANKMDYLALSFVQNSDEIAQVREFLKNNNAQNILLIAKIESGKGVQNMNSIIKAADGVMVARGDLGVEVDYYKLPFIQKKMLQVAKNHNKFAITATQMLDSMINNSFPTRAEVTDVANAVLDGSGAVMLSGETASGINPSRCVKVMNKILVECEKHINYENIFKEVDAHFHDLSSSIVHSAVSSSFSLNAKYIMVATRSGKTSQLASSLRPKANIIVCTPNLNTYYQTSILFGTMPVLTTEKHSVKEIMDCAETLCKNKGIFKSGDLIVQTVGFEKLETDTTKVSIIK